MCFLVNSIVLHIKSHDMKFVQQRYDAAVALNNMGLDLLERHCYREAFKNLKEAASLILTQYDDVSLKQIVTLLERSSQRSLGASPRESALEIKAVKHTFSADTVNAVLDDALCSNILYPIFLEREKWENDRSSQILELSSCIILHNIAVACTGIAQVTKNGIKAKSIFETSIRYFEMAFHLSRNLLEQETVPHHDALQISLLIVSQWLHTAGHSQLGPHKPNHQPYVLLLGVREAVLDIMTDGSCTEYEDFSHLTLVPL
jgi:hypothetical protein